MSSDDPGIRRRRSGKRFVYLTTQGARLGDETRLRQIAALAVPPAWTDVWICASSHGHLQATGRDARGRKQYRYHPRWRKVRDEAKYDDLLSFAACLPKLRKELAADIARRKLTKKKVIATVLRIMEQTCIRVGNDHYADTNGSYGLTTLRDRHARVTQGLVEFYFRGKGGKAHRATLYDRRLAAIVKRCRDVPGQRLFQYEDSYGRYRPVTSGDVNDYIKRTTGRAFTAKSLRTWAATLGAALLLYNCRPCRSRARAKRAINRALAGVAEQLGNTPAICRSCYVHPLILDSYASGALHAHFDASRIRARPRRAGLSADEDAVLALLARFSGSEERAAA